MKLIASDYDGTFNYGGVDDKKLEAVKAWRRAGNLFGLVSGRGTADVIKIQKEKNIECDFLIANNGAVIIGADGRVMSDIRCEGSIAAPLINFVFSLGCSFVSVNGAVSFKVYKSIEEAVRDDGFTPDSVPEIEYFNQISTMLDDDEQAAAVTEKIRDKFGGKLNPLQNGRCIDIVHRDVNKAKGIYNLLNAVGAGHGDVIAVGDNVNDADMIREFYSYAMDNAVDYIKEIADCRTCGITDLIETELAKI